uniref:Uncharacterized protein n=1 Tax=Trypanosoma vivax (strain Y486) TaxID=1055687 RepID=G0U0N0_TRYVY|nr:hypothetical protein TVY486_0802380 [Trypanosoma vivax Y486]
MLRSLRSEKKKKTTITKVAAAWAHWHRNVARAAAGFWELALAQPNLRTNLATGCSLICSLVEPWGHGALQPLRTRTQQQRTLLRSRPPRRLKRQTVPSNQLHQPGGVRYPPATPPLCASGDFASSDQKTEAPLSQYKRPLPVLSLSERARRVSGLIASAHSQKGVRAHEPLGGDQKAKRILLEPSPAVHRNALRAGTATIIIRIWVMVSSRLGGCTHKTILFRVRSYALLTHTVGPHGACGSATEQNHDRAQA